jgi:hypothetical protein
VNATSEFSDQELIQAVDALHQQACSAQRELFAVIVRVDRHKAWRDSGARDMAHWLRMRLGISEWKARRWMAAAHALEDLPLVSQAFSSGELGVDKVVELTRFATSETEGDLLRWAKHVSCAAIRHKGDLALRPSIVEAKDAEKARSLTWWYFEENRRFGLQAELPAADGAVVQKALERLAESLPVMPGEEDACYADARRADALVALCSARISNDPDPDRATVVVHAQLDGLISGDGGCEIENGPVIHPETAKRLLCEARVQTVIEDKAGLPVRLGRTTRIPPGWMVRQLKHRDLECRFPGCGTRQFTKAHHIRWWGHGGSTDLDNLLLVCSFHHKLVHEYGWSVARKKDGMALWFRPDGAPYRSGPRPPPGQGGTTTARAFWVGPSSGGRRDAARTAPALPLPA